MTTYATTALGFWHLIKKCFNSYAAIYKKSWQIVLVAAIVSCIAGLISVFSPVIVGIITVVLFLFATLLNAMIFHQGDATLSGRSETTAKAFTAVKKCYLPFLACYFIISVLMFLMILCVLMSIFTMGSGLAALSAYFNVQIAQLPAWWGAVFLVFAIIFLIATVFLYVAPPLVVLKNSGAFAALKQSADLIKRNWWRIFGILLIIHLIMLLLFFVIGLIFPANHSLLLGLRSFIFQMLVYPLPIATALSLLKDLQLRVGKK